MGIQDKLNHQVSTLIGKMTVDQIAANLQIEELQTEVARLQAEVERLTKAFGASSDG